MNLRLISFTAAGCRTGLRVAAGLAGEDFVVEQFTKSAYTENSGVCQVRESLAVWTEESFGKADALLFIGACGIAVRSIAPFVRDKKHDPAVVVMDEKGRFSISLLSGHIGGANQLAERIAEIVGAIPVVTTATDLNGRFAVDVFAQKNGCRISDMVCAKKVSAAILAGEPVGFYSDFPISGRLPEGLVQSGGEDPFPGIGIVISISEREKPYRHTLYLTPAIVTLGIGCRKGIRAEAIERAVRLVCDESGICDRAVEQVATIDIKGKEPGLLEFCREKELPLVTYPAGELALAEGDFQESEFVKKQVGVGNVCERSACLASHNGKIIHGKYAADGVTVAAAVREWRVWFE